MIGFFHDNAVITDRYKGLKWMYVITSISIVITILCLTVSNSYQSFPIWLPNFLRQLYFVASPILAPFYVVYAMSIVYSNQSYSSFFSKYLWVVLPYFIYLVFVFSNPVHNLIFSFSENLGYIKGPLSQVSYYIAFLYFAILAIFTLRHRRSPQINVLVIICINFLLSTVVFSMQIFIPEVQLSGLACTSGLLVVHLYILSVSKSMDPLTELSNRQTLAIHLQSLSEKNSPYYLCVFSIVNFKSINDRLGLDFGDAVLSGLSSRMRDILPSKNLYRYGGDEFAYLTLHSDDIETENNVLKNVMTDICKPFIHGNSQLSLDLVYARVDFPSFGKDAKEIISAIDYSISTAKKSLGETNFFYDSSVVTNMKRRNFIIETLKDAIENDKFEVYYQGIYSAEKSVFSMAEALIRLKSETFISPGEFIPIAEDTGLINKITYIVLEKVCKDYVSFKDSLGSRFSSISINFPYVHFLQKNTVQKVCNVMDSYNVPYSAIKMELTERTLVSDTMRVKTTMDEFIQHGFEFELDDFGVEYSNLSLFFDIPIKIIKFDRSLVYASTKDKTRRNFFENLLSAIKALDIQVVMEGVEEQELLDYLLRSGCDYIQGYVFTKPLPCPEFVEFIKSRNDNVM